MTDAAWSHDERLRLEQRARALAAPVRSEARLAKHPVLVAQSGRERCGLPLPCVRGVARLRRLVPLPATSPEVAGLFAYEGEILIAFHLRAILELPLSALPEYARVVVVGRHGPEAGLVVEEIEDVIEVEDAALGPVPERFSPRARALLRGVTATGLPLVDGDALLDGDALVVRSTRISLRESP